MMSVMRAFHSPIVIVMVVERNVFLPRVVIVNGTSLFRGDFPALGSLADAETVILGLRLRLRRDAGGKILIQVIKALGILSDRFTAGRETAGCRLSAQGEAPVKEGRSSHILIFRI